MLLSLLCLTAAIEVTSEKRKGHHRVRRARADDPKLLSKLKKLGPKFKERATVLKEKFDSLKEKYDTAKNIIELADAWREAANAASGGDQIRALGKIIGAIGAFTGADEVPGVAEFLNAYEKMCTSIADSVDTIVKIVVERDKVGLELDGYCGPAHSGAWPGGRGFENNLKLRCGKATAADIGRDLIGDVIKVESLIKALHPEKKSPISRGKLGKVGNFLGFSVDSVDRKAFAEYLNKYPKILQMALWGPAPAKPAKREDLKWCCQVGPDPLLTFPDEAAPAPSPSE